MFEFNHIRIETENQNWSNSNDTRPLWCFVFGRNRASTSVGPVTGAHRGRGPRRISVFPSNYLRATANPVTQPVSSTGRRSPVLPTPRRGRTRSPPRPSPRAPGPIRRPAGARPPSSRPAGFLTSSSGRRCSWWWTRATHANIWTTSWRSARDPRASCALPPRSTAANRWPWRRWTWENSSGGSFCSTRWAELNVTLELKISHEIYASSE